MKVKRRQRKRRVERTGISIDDVGKLEKLYLNGLRHLEAQRDCKIWVNYQWRKLKCIRKRNHFSTNIVHVASDSQGFKVVVNDINEIWSVDLAYVDKLAKYNDGVKYLLVAVDCLSRYLRVEPLKTKYATETAQVFKKMIKHRQPEKVWVDDSTEYLGAFKALWTERGIHLYSTFSEKKSAFAERNIRSLKNII